MTTRELKYKLNEALLGKLQALFAVLPTIRRGQKEGTYRGVKYYLDLYGVVNSEYSLKATKEVNSWKHLQYLGGDDWAISFIVGFFGALGGLIVGVWTQLLPEPESLGYIPYILHVAHIIVGFVISSGAYIYFTTDIHKCEPANIILSWFMPLKKEVHIELPEMLSEEMFDLLDELIEHFTKLKNQSDKKYESEAKQAAEDEKEKLQNLYDKVQAKEETEEVLK